ncbi:hypothetical protein HWV62_26384 [Athelia sp. TMB]|nr:hypothetical protein HWV62_26384 [Athelia sp. TMB]
MDPEALSDIHTFIPPPGSPSSESSPSTSKSSLSTPNTTPGEVGEALLDAITFPDATTSSDNTSQSTTSLPVHRTVSEDDTDLENNPSARISFAPLPVIAPRKRKNSIKLGVAARSAIMSRRRAQQAAERAGEELPPDPTPVVQVRVRATSGDLWQDRARTPRSVRMGPEDGDEDELPEDPFVAMGRVLKGVWRRVASPPATPPVKEMKQRPGRIRRASSEGTGVAVPARVEDADETDEIGMLPRANGQTHDRCPQPKSILKVRKHPVLHRMASEPANFGFTPKLSTPPPPSQAGLEGAALAQ